MPSCITNDVVFSNLERKMLISWLFSYPIGLQHNAAETNSTIERGGLMFFLMWTFMMFGVTFASMVSPMSC